jgi:nicotinate-nucleotide--dimethylbenzimidazole phosphoribosyltransferase
VLLIAHQMNPEISKNAVFYHCSEEQAHVKNIDFFYKQTCFTIRRIEGTGCAIAFPIINQQRCF